MMVRRCGSNGQLRSAVEFVGVFAAALFQQHTQQGCSGTHAHHACNTTCAPCAGGRCVCSALHTGRRGLSSQPCRLRGGVAWLEGLVDGVHEGLADADVAGVDDVGVAVGVAGAADGDEWAAGVLVDLDGRGGLGVRSLQALAVPQGLCGEGAGGGDVGAHKLGRVRATEGMQAGGQGCEAVNRLRS